MKVLVVEDDLVLSDVISFTLRRAGFEVLTVYDGQSGYERWQSENPDLVILDIKLPKLDGLTVCKKIRAQGTTPIIILSAQGSDEDVVQGLEFGADDYLAKPFSPTQLIARIRALLRRAGMTPLNSVSEITKGDLRLDVGLREVQLGDTQERIQLTQLECRLLEVLMINFNHVLPNNVLIGHIWGIDGGDKVMLRQIVHRLRQKIEPDPPLDTHIETVPGVGYALVRRTGGN